MRQENKHEACREREHVGLVRNLGDSNFMITECKAISCNIPKIGRSICNSRTIIRSLKPFNLYEPCLSIYTASLYQKILNQTSSS